MIIMQTLDAPARREYIESNKLAKVIFAHKLEESVCIQYHPKGIKGGMMPELDSHYQSKDHSNPLNERFSPWHAAGPMALYPQYSAGMRARGHLHLLGVALRLATGDTNTQGAAVQWYDTFGIEMGNNHSEIRFTNATMNFLPGESGINDGLAEIVVGVEGEEIRKAILARACTEGCRVDKGLVHMLGTNWNFVPISKTKSRL